MLELIDIRTLAIGSVLILVILALVMILYQTQRKTYRGFRSWVWAQGMFALAYLAFGTRDILPDIFSIVLGNGMALTGFFFARQGFRKFFDRQPYTQRDNIIIPVFAILLLTLFTFQQNRVDIRMIVVGLSVAWMSFRIAYELFTGIPVEMRGGAWVGAVIFALAGIIALFRGITAMMHPEQVSFFSPTLTNISIYILAIFVGIASTFSAIMLTSTRLELELKTAQQQMELLAHTDPLTGLYNRRYFVESAQREFVRARRFKHTASVLFTDLDHFKQINDTYGHSVGDAVLTRVGKIISAHVRQVDLTARLGGEEFIVLLILGAEETLPNIADRIREAIERDVLELDGKTIRYTVSIGVAFLLPNDKSIQDLIDRADAALYRAKQNGRNQVQIG